MKKSGCNTIGSTSVPFETPKFKTALAFRAVVSSVCVDENSVGETCCFIEFSHSLIKLTIHHEIGKAFHIGSEYEVTVFSDGTFCYQLTTT